MLSERNMRYHFSNFVSQVLKHSNLPDSLRDDVLEYCMSVVFYKDGYNATKVMSMLTGRGLIGSSSRTKMTTVTIIFTAVTKIAGGVRTKSVMCWQVPGVFLSRLKGGRTRCPNHLAENGAKTGKNGTFWFFVGAPHKY